MVPPWFARSLTRPALKGASTPRRDDGRSRRSLTGQARSVRDSEAIFYTVFSTPFHLPGLSAASFRAYSPLHCLYSVSLLPLNLHQNGGLVKRFFLGKRPQVHRDFLERNLGRGGGEETARCRPFRPGGRAHPTRRMNCRWATGTEARQSSSASRKTTGAARCSELEGKERTSSSRAVRDAPTTRMMTKKTVR